MMSSDTEPKMATIGVCEPPPTPKPTAAAMGTTIAARTARRSASRSGSRSRIRSTARRRTPAGVSMHRMLDRRGRRYQLVLGKRAEPTRIQRVEQLSGDPLDVAVVAWRQRGLLIADQK